MYVYIENRFLKVLTLYMPRVLVCVCVGVRAVAPVLVHLLLRFELFCPTLVALLMSFH